MFIHRRLLAPEGEGQTSTTPQPTSTTPPAQPDLPSDASGDFPGKKHMAEEINRLRRENEEILAKQKAASDEAERKRLEEQGKWQEIAAKERADRELLEKTHAAKEREWKLRAKLVGLPDLMIDGAIAKCSPDENIDEYAEKIMKSSEAYLQSVEPARRIAQGIGGGSGGGNWAADKALIEKVESGELVNPKELDAAYSRVLKYQAEHDGKRPW